MEDKSNYIIISLGGSIIVPDEIDTKYVKEFVETIEDYIKKGYKFVIITGGGNVCRRYNHSIEHIINPSDEDLDWVGIAVTRLNAELVRVSFNGLAYEKVLQNPDKIPETDKPVIVGGGWKPGNSSDLAAVRIAYNLGAKKIINLSNIDFAYDKDPNIYPDAVKIEHSSWFDFRKILPESWIPGVNVPFDPVAAEEAEKNDLEVVIMNGHNVDNFRNYLENKEFLGTTIKN